MKQSTKRIATKVVFIIMIIAMVLFTILPFLTV